MQDTPENQNLPTPPTSSDEPTLPSQPIPPEPPTEPSTQPTLADVANPRVSRVVVWSSVIGALVIVGLIVALLLRPAPGGSATQTSNTPGQNTATTGATQPAISPSPTTTVAANGTPTLPAAPTVTGAPKAPTFLVSDKNVTEECSKGLWPFSITIGNTGATPLQWSATAPQGVTLTPSSGTLAAGSQNLPTLQQVQLSGTYSQSEFTIAFTSTGGNESVKVTCI